MSRVSGEVLKERGIELPSGFHLEDEVDFLFLYFGEEKIANFSSSGVDSKEIEKEAEEYLKRTGRAKEVKREERKPLTAHERVGVLLGEVPVGHLYTLAQMYRVKAVVPAKDIPRLIEAFQEAKKRMVALVDEAIEALEEQMKEAEEKEKETEEKDD